MSRFYASECVIVENKRFPRKNRFLEVATPLGFEPRITPPRGAVLLLHHGVCGICDFRLAIFDSSAMPKIRVRSGLSEATRCRN